MNFEQYVRKVRKASGIADRCREIDVDPPCWVVHLLNHPIGRKVLADLKAAA